MGLEGEKENNTVEVYERRVVKEVYCHSDTDLPGEVRIRVAIHLLHHRLSYTSTLVFSFSSSNPMMNSPLVVRSLGLSVHLAWSNLVLV